MTNRACIYYAKICNSFLWITQVQPKFGGKREFFTCLIPNKNITDRGVPITVTFKLTHCVGRLRNRLIIWNRWGTAMFVCGGCLSPLKHSFQSSTNCNPSRQKTVCTYSMAQDLNPQSFVLTITLGHAARAYILYGLFTGNTIFVALCWTTESNTVKTDPNLVRNCRTRYAMWIVFRINTPLMPTKTLETNNYIIWVP
jgi:hypothetical protein